MKRRTRKVFLWSLSWNSVSPFNFPFTPLQELRDRLRDEILPEVHHICFGFSSQLFHGIGYPGFFIKEIQSQTDPNPKCDCSRYNKKYRDGYGHEKNAQTD